MKKPFNAGIFAAVLSLLLVGCASGPAYQPVASQPESIDMDAFAPKVEAFVVLLDISSSMGEDYQDRPKVQIAQDLVASFNATVPPADFKAGLVTFGNGSGRCLGRGEGKGVYGLEAYQTADFASALGSIECAGGTTPMSEGVDATAQMLSGQSGPVAVIIVSDFQWVAARPVNRSVEALKAQHGENLCLHTVKVGDNTTGDALIASIANTPGCDSSVAAGDIASAGGMANYVTGVLLAPLEYEKHAVSATALFDFDRAVLKEQGKAELRNLAEYIKGKGITVADIDVIGHTDSMGSEEYNQDLSERRAMAVKEYLVSMGVDSAIIDVSGKGESEPVASNDTEEGRAQNRRVEIHVGTTRLKN
jgi:OOP family OmpA-OmpF porin